MSSKYANKNKDNKNIYPTKEIYIRGEIRKDSRSVMCPNCLRESFESVLIRKCVCGTTFQIKKY